MEESIIRNIRDLFGRIIASELVVGAGSCYFSTVFMSNLAIWIVIVNIARCLWEDYKFAKPGYSIITFRVCSWERSTNDELYFGIDSLQGVFTGYLATLGVAYVVVERVLIIKDDSWISWEEEEECLLSFPILFNDEERVLF